MSQIRSAVVLAAYAICTYIMSGAARDVRLRQVAAELSDARSALKKARRAQREAAAATTRQWVFTEQLSNTVILMCWQAGGDVSPAVKASV